MEKYMFDTHYGVYTMTDTENGVTVKWEAGKFNTTQEFVLDPTSLLYVKYNANELAQVLAGICKDMGDYITNNYPELI